MGQVTAFRLAGLDLWFNSNDHRPPHFHAEKPGDWEVVVRFLRGRLDMFQIVWTKRKGSPGQAELRLIAAAVEEHREALLAEWEAKVAVKDPGPKR